MRFSLMAAGAFLALCLGAAAQEASVYTYDVLGRLVATSTYGGANNGSTSTYSYDPASNRTNVTVLASDGGALTASPVILSRSKASAGMAGPPSMSICGAHSSAQEMCISLIS